MNNSSTYKVLERTLATTNTHVEHDRSGKVEVEWGDSSISYNAYTKYDEREIVIPDTSISDDEKIKMRHTHLFTPSSLSEELDAMNRYYREHNLGPWKYAFKGPQNSQENNEQSEEQEQEQEPELQNIENLEENNENPINNETQSEDKK